MAEQEEIRSADQEAPPLSNELVDDEIHPDTASSRRLDAGVEVAPEGLDVSPAAAAIATEGETESEGMPVLAEEAAPAAFESVDWSNEMSGQRIYLEICRIEDEVRRLLESKDPVRKRKLVGTRRWRELEEDVIQWRFGDRFDEATLARVRQLVARRHHLFQRIRFLAATRPTWNT